MRALFAASRANLARGNVKAAISKIRDQPVTVKQAAP